MDQLDIIIQKGADFLLEVTIYDSEYNVVDLTGATVQAQLREYAEASDCYEFIGTHNGSGGTVTLSMPHETTSLIGFTSGVYDVKITQADETVSYPISGTATIIANVTKIIDGSVLYMVGVMTYSDLPAMGYANRLYFVYSDKKIYRWNGLQYIVVVESSEDIIPGEFELAWERQGINQYTGVPYVSDTSLCTQLLSIKKYVLTFDYSRDLDLVLNVGMYTQDGTFIGLRDAASIYNGRNDWFPESVAYVRMMVSKEDGTDLTNADINDIISISISGTPDSTAKEFTKDTVSTMTEGSYPIGTFVRTLGFNTVGDFGEALYSIKESSGDYTVNNCSVFQDSNGNYIVREFDKPYLYLESLNVENLPWETVNGVVEASGILDVRAYILNLDHNIEISNYDFTFEQIISSASIALTLIDMNGKKVTGSYIEAIGSDTATGLYITTKDANFIYNHVDIRKIKAAGTVAYIRPYGHGICYNSYYFGDIHGYKYPYGDGPYYGLRIHIPAVRDGGGNLILDEDNLPVYSFEGEDIFKIEKIYVSNLRSSQGVVRGGTAKALAMTIEVCDDETFSQDVDTSVFGTITGLTFHNISMEAVDVGVYMRCGTKSPFSSDRTDSGIKSVIINNMRVREAARYFDMVGYLRDVYIKPTSKLKLSYIGYEDDEHIVHSGYEYDAVNDKYIYPIVNTAEQYVVIDCPGYNETFAGMKSYARGDGLGTRLIAAKGFLFFDQKTSDQLYVTSSTTYDTQRSPVKVENIDGEYVVRKFYENSYPCASNFYITNDLSGTSEIPSTVVLDLREFYYQNSAKDIKISVPAYCVVAVKMNVSGRKTICSSSSSRKFYTITQYNKRMSLASAVIVVSEENVKSSL